MHNMTQYDTTDHMLSTNMQLSDLKRFNGLISETEIFGRDVLLVPTKLFPVG